jgi:hypothetical protein
MAKSMNLSRLEFAGVAAVRFCLNYQIVRFTELREKQRSIQQFAFQRDFTAKKRVREPDLCRFYLN